MPLRNDEGRMLGQQTQRNSELRRATVTARESQYVYSVQLPNGQTVRAKVSGQDAFIVDQQVQIDRTRTDQQWTIVTRSPEGQFEKIPHEQTTRKRPMRRQEEDPGQSLLPTPERLLLLADKCYAVSTSGGAVMTSAAFSSAALAGVLSADGRTLYALLTGGGFAVIDTRTLEITYTMDAATVPYEVADYAQIAYDENGWIWFHSGNTLRRLNVLNGECNFVLLSPDNSTWPYCVSYSATHDEIYAVHPGDTLRRLWRLNPATGAVIATYTRTVYTQYLNWRIISTTQEEGAARVTVLGIDTGGLEMAGLEWYRTALQWGNEDPYYPAPSTGALPTATCRPVDGVADDFLVHYGVLVDPSANTETDPLSYRYRFARTGITPPEIRTTGVTPLTAECRGPASRLGSDSNSIYYSRGTSIDQIDAPYDLPGDLTVTRSFTATGITAASPIFYVPSFG